MVKITLKHMGKVVWFPGSLRRAQEFSFSHILDNQIFGASEDNLMVALQRSTHAPSSVNLTGIENPPVTPAYLKSFMKCQTHSNISDVPELDILDGGADVLEVPDVHLDDGGDVHGLHQHVQHYVRHVQLKSEEPSHLEKEAGRRWPSVVPCRWPRS